MSSFETSQNYEEISLEKELEPVKELTTKELQEFKSEEKLAEKPYSLEESDKNITVHFGDFSLSLNSGEKNSDKKPFINHSVEGYIYPKDLADIQDFGPYKPTGNILVDSFFKTLNLYEFPKLQDSDIKRLLEKTKQRN